MSCGLGELAGPAAVATIADAVVREPAPGAGPAGAAVVPVVARVPGAHRAPAAAPVPAVAAHHAATIIPEEAWRAGFRTLTYSEKYIT